MRSRGRDELESSAFLELPECADDVCVDCVVEIAQARKPITPVLNYGNEMRVVGIPHLCFCFVARGESLSEELAQLALENRARELIGEDWSYAEGDRRGDVIICELMKGLDQR